MARLVFPDKVKYDIKKNILNKKIPKITINEKRKIIDKVKILSKDVHMEIFYFLKKKMSDEYTINQNGVFINLNHIDNDTLYSLREMVNFYIKNEKKLKESYLERYCNKNHNIENECNNLEILDNLNKNINEDLSEFSGDENN